MTITNKISILKLLLLIISPLTFLLLLYSSISFDIIFLICFAIIIVYSFFDQTNLLLGWFIFAPYFHLTGEVGKANLASNLSHNLFIPLMGVIIFVNGIFKNRHLFLGKEVKLFLLFILFLIISTLLTGGSYSVFRDIFIIYFLPWLLYIISSNIYLDKYFIKNLVNISIFHVIVLSLIVYIEFKSGTSIFTGLLRWQDVAQGRPAGPFKSPFILGMFVQFCLFIIYFGYKEKYLSKIIFYFSFFLTAIISYFTFTRTVWISFVIVVIYFFYKTELKRSLKLFVVASFLIILVWGFFIIADQADVGSRIQQDTATIRLLVAYATMKIFLDYPLFGAGFGSVDTLIPTYIPIDDPLFTTSHVTILTLLAEMGIIGTSLLVLFFVYIYRENHKKYAISKAKQNYFHKVVIGFSLIFLVNSFLYDLRFFTIAYSILFFMLGLDKNILYGNEELKNHL